MTSRELLRTRKENADRLTRESRMSNNRNHVRMHPQNSAEHELKKVEICWNLLQEGKEFITEAEFEDRDIRADIFVLDDGKIYEIETSEYELEERKSEYPYEDVEVVFLEDEDTNFADLL